MTGFSIEWLKRREPVDARSRNRALLHEAAALLTEPDALAVDLGCGIGATSRSFAPLTSPTIRWRLIDHDPRLLAEAAQACPQAEITTADLRDIAELPLDAATLVTASALFDLCSASYIERLTSHLARNALPLYAALNFDGTITWDEPHELDAAIITHFNHHQRRDKGFGPACGSEAAGHLTDQFAQFGYRVRTAPSPWQMDAADAALQTDLLTGIHDAVAETGAIDPTALAAWRHHRLSAIDRNIRCTVGHIDLLATPPTASNPVITHAP